MRVDVLGWLVLAVALGLLACPPAPPPPAPVQAPAPPPPGDFSEERAWRHVEALARVGPRGAGTDGAARAREYLVAQLQALDLQVTEQRIRVEPGPAGRGLETVNLLAAIPGPSTDAILLVAPYDSPPGVPGAGVNDGASGAALVLELGRALQVRAPAYSVWLAFVEGDALARGAGPDPLQQEAVGTAALVAILARDARLEHVRLAVYANRVAAPDLRVARDLLSSRALREEFWSAAHRRGSVATFPPEAPFEVLEEGQRAFVAAGMRRVVAIAGVSEVAGDAEAGRGHGDDLARASSRSLATVGAVSLDALVAISERLAKIDSFVRSPIGSAQDASEPPGEPGAAIEPGEASEADAAP